MDKPISLEDETDVEVQMEFFSDVNEEKMQWCSNVETDVTFEIQHAQSTYFSSLKYYRLDTQTIEEFPFHGEHGTFGRLRFNGKTLTCIGDQNGTKCHSLPVGQHVPVILLSLHFKPQNVFTQSLTLNPNKYSLRGSYYSPRCTGNVQTISVLNVNMIYIILVVPVV